MSTYSSNADVSKMENPTVSQAVSQKSELKKSRFKPKTFIRYALLLFYTFITCYPLYFTFLSSFKNDTEIFSRPFSLPDVWRWENYVRALIEGNIGVYFFNTLIVSIGSLIPTILLGVMLAFAIAKVNIKFNGLLLGFFTLGLMIPIISIIIPITYMIGMLGLRDSFLAFFLLYTAFGLPITVFLSTAFIRTIPLSLIEAALIDGASLPKIFWVIILPLSKSAVFTAGIFSIIGTWNDLLFPLMIVTKESMRTISLGLASFVGQYYQDQSGLLAAIVMASIVPIGIYMKFSTVVQKGVTVGAVKG